jgi:hypothetical protein
MRLVSCTALLCLAAAPSMAQSRSRSDADIVRALNNPIVQEAVAAMASQLAGVVLDTRAGPLAHYADPDIRPNDTLRDIERRRDPDFEKRLHADARRALGSAGAIAGEVLATRDELSRTAERLRAALAPLEAAIDPKSDRSTQDNY